MLKLNTIFNLNRTLQFPKFSFGKNYFEIQINISFAILISNFYLFIYKFLENQLKRSIVELIFAGTETTVNTLRWGVLLMARYPNVQKRVHEEIDRELGNTAPKYGKRKNLKFTEAVLCEIQRVATLIPFLPHRTTSTTTLRGYTIPENSIIIPNSMAVHRDQEVWQDPEYFHVENFFDESTNVIIKTDHLIPFGIGMPILKLYISLGLYNFMIGEK